MVPKIKTDEMSMSSETFEKMLLTVEKMFEKGASNHVSFRLSGGEPFLVWKNYADLVTKYHEKYGNKMSFGVLELFGNFSFRTTSIKNAVL
jgi:sulfatase maturation enzyme AslB (radical SAM superfamily)